MTVDKIVLGLACESLAKYMLRGGMIAKPGVDPHSPVSGKCLPAAGGKYIPDFLDAFVTSN
jgi:hypothetical protein